MKHLKLLKNKILFLHIVVTFTDWVLYNTLFLLEPLIVPMFSYELRVTCALRLEPTLQTCCDVMAVVAWIQLFPLTKLKTSLRMTHRKSHSTVMTANRLFSDEDCYLLICTFHY